MIAVDTNLLVYAHRAGCAEHSAARRAIEDAANTEGGWGIPAPCLLEFWSVATHPSSTGGGSSPALARRFIDALIETAGAAILPPPQAVIPRCLQLAEQLDVRGPRIFDLQISLAALDAGVTEIWTHDSGFIALPGLKIRVPFARNAVIAVSSLTLSFGNRPLFKDVNLKFTPGNCYGIIGANGSGKSSLLKILSGELEADKGDIAVGAGKRMSVLGQDHFAFEEQRVLDTVIMGSSRLHAVGKEREALYAKADFTEADGMRASELEAEYAELGGWEAEAQAATLLPGLGTPEAMHDKLMRDVDEGVKVRVLLAQALFGNPDILLLDEPTNGLDLGSISWLEEFLIEFPNIVIVVSHDRHFLNAVCTHTCDIDFGQVRMYAGNYDFWFRINKILAQQQKDERKRREEKVEDLKEFIHRFAANVSKSRQATSRKKILEKLDVDDYVASSRRFPYVGFKPLRAVGNVVLEIEALSKSLEGKPVLAGLDLSVRPGDKIAFVGREHLAKTALFRILANEDTPDSGNFLWGQTVSWSYFPRENAALFDSNMPLVSWLAQYSSTDDETFVRSFLGRMLFTGDDGLKPVRVLSGGERVRCILARLMLSGANCLILDEPTNHLDLEAIEALDEGLVDFSGVLLFTSHDHEFVTSIANRIVEICPGGVIDRAMSFDDYLSDAKISELRDRYYHGHVVAEI